MTMHKHLHKTPGKRTVPKEGTCHKCKGAIVGSMKGIRRHLEKCDKASPEERAHFAKFGRWPR